MGFGLSSPAIYSVTKQECKPIIDRVEKAGSKETAIAHCKSAAGTRSIITYPGRKIGNWITTAADWMGGPAKKRYGSAPNKGIDASSKDNKSDFGTHHKEELQQCADLKKIIEKCDNYLK